MQETKIAILGNRDSIQGFKNLGLVAIGLDSAEDPAATIESALNEGGYGIIFITEDWHEQHAELLAEYKERPLPAIITIPSSRGTTGESMRELRRMVEQAVGSDILSN